MRRLPEPCPEFDCCVNLGQLPGADSRDRLRGIGDQTTALQSGICTGNAMSVDTTAGHFQPTRLMRNASAYHRMLRRRFAMPRKLVNPAIRGLKHLVNPSQTSKRVATAKLAGPGNEADRQLASDGYVLFDREALPDLQRALEVHRDDLLDLVRAAEARHMNKTANKQMLTTVVRNDGFFDLPEIMKFVVSRPIVELATRYFGRVPVLTSVSLWWSPPNDSMQQSQLYHCDGEDARQLKYFFNITDVTQEQGPFTLLPGEISDRIRAAKGIVARKVRDEEIDEFDGDRQKLVLTGKSGEGACVDTCRCLHYGSRGNSKARVLLMLRFNDHLAPNVDIPDWHPRAKEFPGGLDDLQKLVLGIQSD